MCSSRSAAIHCGSSLSLEAIAYHVHKCGEPLIPWMVLVWLFPISQFRKVPRCNESHNSESQHTPWGCAATFFVTLSTSFGTVVASVYKSNASMLVTNVPNMSRMVEPTD